MTSISNNYPILSKNYYQVAQNSCAPAFLGEGVESNPLPAQATPPSQLSYPPDTVEISAKDKIQKQQKSKGMSTATKVGLTVVGGLATAYACVVGHRMLTKPTLEKVAQNFSEIFRRDISKDEATQMVERYKDIFKEKDKDTFIQRCFNQAKKDFGYEHLDINIGKLSQAEIKESAKEGTVLGGGYRPLGVIFKNSDGTGSTLITNNTVIEANPNLSKQKIFENIIHELTHLKQHEIAYRSNKQGLYEAIKEARFSILKGKSFYDKITGEYLNEFERVYGNTFDKLPKINEGSKDYELAQKYIEDIKHYCGGGKSSSEYNKYREQFIEQEAHGTAPKAQEIFNCFANPWRIF